MRGMLVALVVLGACDDGAEDTAAEAPVVEADVFEYECVADETHVFEEVRFTGGEWVDAQLWREHNPDAVMQFGSGLANGDEQATQWTRYVFGLNPDGHALAPCGLGEDGLSYLRYRLLVRR